MDIPKSHTNLKPISFKEFLELKCIFSSVPPFMAVKFGEFHDVA